MKKRFMLGLVGALTACVLGAAPAMAAASDVFSSNPGCSSGSGANICGGGGDGLFKTLGAVVNVLLVVGGVIAVIMIIVGGIRYSTSNGDQAHVKAAKDTILYSVIGLVVSVLSFAIVNFVVGRL